MNAPTSIIRARHAAGAIALLAACLACAQQARPAAETDPRQAALKQEIEYIRLLQSQMQMPDFAELVIQDAKRAYPEAAVQLRVLEIEGLLALGKFEDVQTQINARTDADSVETWGLKLALADGYFHSGKYGESKALYDAFFKRFEKQPPEPAAFFRDAAYKYVQMMLHLKQDRAALDGYRRMLKQKLEPHVERQVRGEMAELMVRVAETTDKEAERKALLEEADKTVDPLLWVLDMWFGKAVVLKAHVKQINGKVDDAQAMVENYMPQLKQIHESLVNEEKEQNVTGLVRLSPMAECRYLLAVMSYDEALKLMKTPGYDQERVKSLLFGAKGPDGRRSGNGAFNHFVNVFVLYPESQWAVESGARTDEIRDLVKKTFGVTVSIPITAAQRAKMEEKQFSEARVLFNGGHYAKAAEALVSVANRFPPSAALIAVLGDLTRSYAELNDDLGADTVAGHLSERFCQNAELQETAGNEVIRLAMFYADRKQDGKSVALYDSYMTNYLSHSMRAMTLMRFGDQALKQENAEAALGYYNRVISDCTNSLAYYLAALSRKAQILEEKGDHPAAAAALTALIQETEARSKPDAALVSAKFRLAQNQKNMAVAALRASGTNDPAAVSRDLIKAASLFGQLAKELGDANGPFSRNAEDRDRNAAVLEAALFNKAYCLQLVTAPADKVPALQKMAVDGYTELATRFPKSKYAPGALMQAGSIRSLAKDSAGANELFERLRKEFPDSSEAKNVLFEMGRRFLDMGFRAEAVETFKKMFTEQGAYSDAQILLAGQELLKSKEYDLAGQAFDRVIASTKEQTVRVSAQLGKAEAQIAQEKFGTAIPALEALATALQKSTRLVDVSLLLSRAASAQGMREQNADKRLELFNSAVKAIKTVRTYRTNQLERAQTDIEVAKLLTLRARAEEKFGTADAARKYLGQAVAAYQALLMTTDSSNAELAPVLEQAYHENLPMLAEIKRWQDVVDDCNAYLAAFPAGKWVAEVRTLKGQAEIEVSTGGGAPKAPAAGR